VTVPTGDALLSPGVMPVVQWHYDAITELPESVEVLASSELYPIQAFRVGEVAWGLQFHVEATPDMVRAWAAEEGLDATLTEPVAFAAGKLEEVGEAIARRFAAIITG
jgi:GMP synthase-like glutamine amidotransferase